MPSDTNIETWTVEDVTAFFSAAASIEHDQLARKLAPALDKVLEAVKKNEVTGQMLEFVNKEFLEQEAGVTSWADQTAYLVLVKNITKRTAQTLARLAPLQPVIEPNDLPAKFDGPANARSNFGGAHIQAAEIHQASPQESHPASQSNSASTEDQPTVKRRKRAVLETIPARGPPPITLNSPKYKSGYMPTRAIDIDHIFYGTTRFGAQLEADVLDDENFHFYTRPQSHAAATFVSGRCKHFFAKPNVVDVRNAAKQSVTIMPYQFGLKNHPSATLMQVNSDGVCEASRVRIDTTVEGLHISTEDEPIDEYTELMRRYPDRPQSDSDVISIGDVSSQMGISTDDDDDDHSDMAEEGPEETQLRPQDIEVIINNAIVDFTAEWRTNLHKLESTKARSVWRKMRSSKFMRDSLIEGAHRRITHLQERLRSQKSELLRTDFRDAKEVSRNCEIMQPTVEEIEEKRWRIDVWQRRHEPYAPATSRGLEGRNRLRPASSSAVANNLLAQLGAGDRLTSPLSASPTSYEQPASDSATPLGSPESESQHENLADGLRNGQEDDVPMEDFLVDDLGQGFHIAPASGPLRNITAPTADISEKSRAVSPASSVISVSDSRPLSKTPTTRDTRQQKGRGIWGKIQISAAQLPSEDEDEDDERILLSKKRKRAPSTPIKRDPADIERRHQRAVKKATEDMTAEDVDDLDVNVLVLDRLYDKLLLKILSQESPVFRERLHQLCTKYEGQLVKIIPAAIEDLVDDSGAKHLSEFDDAQAQTMLRCARIAFAWWTRNLDALNGEFSDWSDADEFCNDVDQIERFCEQLLRLLEQKHKRLFIRAPPASQANPLLIDSSSDNDDITANGSWTSPHTQPSSKKKRKKLIHNQEARGTREAAHSRQQRFKKMQRSQSDSAKLVELLNDSSQHVELEINPARDPHEPPIHIDHHIARFLKPHQIDGVQFLWRELTARKENDVRGCLLAHAMGLGKTMQTITTMVTILKAAQSSDASIRKQLPKSLRSKEVVQGDRKLRMLILLPPSLIVNWKNEIKQWTRYDLGQVFMLADEKEVGQRLLRLEEWETDGGVLLLGYQMFRELVLMSSKSARTAYADTRAYDILVNSTELIVADEAHAIKSTKSKIHKAVTSLRAKHRLALTGTPLSNDIDEVYALTSWIAPGYFGPQEEFNSRYANPIKDGLFADSTAAERRRSLKKLMVLRTEIEPKYLRADITVLRGAIPPKTEFILLVSPTDKQVTTYKRFTRALSGQADGEEVSQVQMFQWLNALTLLLNHPCAFRKKLLESQKAKKRPFIQSDNDQTDVASDTADLGGASDTVGQQQVEAVKSSEDLAEEDLYVHGLSERTRLDILADYPDDNLDPQLSAKTALFVDILERSLAIGDQMLVFSGTLPTLDYLTNLLTRRRILHGRIDGKTAMSERPKLIKELKDGCINVLLISTRAGGVGLNMQNANRIVIFDSGFNPMHEEQAVGRAYRIGQQKPVFVYRFVTGGTFEVNMENRQLFKTSLAQRVVDKKNPMRNATRNVSRWLYDPKPVEKKDISEWDGKDPGVLDEINRAQRDRREDANQHEIYFIKTMETLQADAKDPELDETEKREVEDEIAEGRSMRLRSRVVQQTENGPASAPVPTIAPTFEVGNVTPTQQAGMHNTFGPVRTGGAASLLSSR